MFKGILEKNEPSYFLSGLRDGICLPVRMLNIINLNDAFGLAKIQEQYGELEYHGSTILLIHVNRI